MKPRKPFGSRSRSNITEAADMRNTIAETVLESPVPCVLQQGAALRQATTLSPPPTWLTFKLLNNPHTMAMHQ